MCKRFLAKVFLSGKSFQGTSFFAEVRDRVFSHLLTNYWKNPLRCYIWLQPAISIILESYCDLCLAVITKVLCSRPLSPTAFGEAHSAPSPLAIVLIIVMAALSSFHNRKDVLNQNQYKRLHRFWKV